MTAQTAGQAAREPRRSETERGFTIYDEFDDARGSKVRVQKSSLATDECLWIFVNDQLATEDRPAHVNVEQATWLRDALNVFIGEHGVRQQPQPAPELDPQ